MTFVTSLCGCVKEPMFMAYPESDHNRMVRTKKFCRTIRRHCRDNPECDKKAESDRMWQFRQPLPIDDPLDSKFEDIPVLEF